MPSSPVSAFSTMKPLAESISSMDRAIIRSSSIKSTRICSPRPRGSRAACGLWVETGFSADRGSRGGYAPVLQDRAGGGQELGHRERLGHHLVGAEFLGPLQEIAAAAVLAAAGDGDDRGLRRSLLGLDDGG